jgi:hypothetical protein
MTENAGTRSAESFCDALATTMQGLIDLIPPEHRREAWRLLEELYERTAPARPGPPRHEISPLVQMTPSGSTASRARPHPPRVPRQAARLGHGRAVGERTEAAAALGARDNKPPEPQA